MRIEFIKRACCTEAGKVIDFIESDRIEIIVDGLLAICNYKLGDNYYAIIYNDLGQLKSEFGENIPEGAEEAMKIASGGIMLSSNGGPFKIVSLPLRNTKKYYQLIIDELTNCDWGDCDVVITGEVVIS